MSKRLLAVIAVAATLFAAPALADRRHGGHWRGGPRAVVVAHPMVYRPAYHRAYYRAVPRVVYAAPAPVYAAPPVVAYPAPVYATRRPYYAGHNSIWPLVGGALVAGAILHDIHHHH